MRLRVLVTVVLVAVIAFGSGVALGALVVAPRLATITRATPTTSPVALISSSPSPGAPPRPTVPVPSGSPVRTQGSPAASSSPSLPPPLPDQTPILYYHRVEPEPPGFAAESLDARRSFLAYDVLPIAFNAQLDWLAANGFHTILPRDLVAHWDRGKALPKRPIILTFDDGTPDWMTQVLPALRRHHMIAEFYVVIENVGKGISWSDVRSLAAAGMGIGAHDLHHVQLAGLGLGEMPASAATMWAEVSGAREILLQEIGVAPDSMAYVGGGFDATLEQLVRQAGYTTARSILRGVIQTPDRRFELRVSRIGAYDDVRNALESPTLVPGLPTFVQRVTGADPG